LFQRKPRVVTADALRQPNLIAGQLLDPQSLRDQLRAAELGQLAGI
jgi:hypothetical protein